MLKCSYFIINAYKRLLKVTKTERLKKKIVLPTQGPTTQIGFVYYHLKAEKFRLEQLEWKTKPY